MPIDKLNLNKRSYVKANYLMISNILLGTAVLSFILTLGGCCSCMSSSETTYESVETPYRKPDGSIGYAAKSHTTPGDPRLFVVSAGICFFTFIGSGIVRAMGEVEEKDDS